MEAFGIDKKISHLLLKLHLHCILTYIKSYDKSSETCWVSTSSFTNGFVDFEMEVALMPVNVYLRA